MTGTYEHHVYSYNPRTLARAYRDAGYSAVVDATPGARKVIVVVGLDAHLAGQDEGVQQLAAVHGAEYGGGVDPSG